MSASSHAAVMAPARARLGRVWVWCPGVSGMGSEPAGKDAAGLAAYGACSNFQDLILRLHFFGSSLCKPASGLLLHVARKKRQVPGAASS